MQSKYRTPVALRDAVAEWQTANQPKDILSTLNQFRISTERPEHLALVPFGKADQPLVMLPHAQNQMLARLGYPQTLLNKLPRQQTENDLNYLAQNYHDKNGCLIRTVQEKFVRGYLTDEYSDYPILTILNTLCNKLPSDAVVVNHFCDLERFFAQFAIPTMDVQVTPKVGDVVRFGITVRTSEVGLHSLTIASGLERLVCTNGATAKSGDGMFFRIVHRGSNHFEERVQGAIDSCLMASTGILAKLKESVNTYIEDTQAEIQRACKEAMTQEQFKTLLNVMTTNQYGDNYKTKYGVFNAITQTANSFTGDTQYEIQQLAMNYLM